MAVVRRNILTSDAACDAYVRATGLLKAEPLVDEGRALTTADLGIPGFRGTPTQPLSTWDLFVYWHHRAMMLETPPGSARNAAHQGPVFLPWHRLMLLLLERNMQRVLGDPDFGLPYWSWAGDGDRPVPQQIASALWAPECMGGDGEPAQLGALQTGPFAAGTGFSVRLWSDSTGRLWAVDRPLRRRFAPGPEGAQPFTLPTGDHVLAALAEDDYDGPDWDTEAPGFRNTLEGWLEVGGLGPPSLHNRVHVWVGGDMDPSTSPNDPVFYLNHCNVDRLWAAWQAQPGDRSYQPPDSAPSELFRHRPGDPLFSFFARDDEGTPWQVEDVFSVSEIYSYDSLAAT